MPELVNALAPKSWRSSGTPARETRAELPFKVRQRREAVNRQNRDRRPPRDTSRNCCGATLTAWQMSASGKRRSVSSRSYVTTCPVGRDKVQRDMSESAFAVELKALEGDAVYRDFGLAKPEYALIRLMGRMSISIGRRLGEIYDKLPRFITQARSDLTAACVAPVIAGKLELDVCVPLNKLQRDDQVHVAEVVERYIPGAASLDQVRQLRFGRQLQSERQRQIAKGRRDGGLLGRGRLPANLPDFQHDLSP